MLSNSSFKYSVREIELLQSIKPVEYSFKVPELFKVSDEEKAVRWIRQLTDNNFDVITTLIEGILTPEMTESFVGAGFDRIVYDSEFSVNFCKCCVLLYQKLQMRELYASLMKCCQSHFTSRQQWTPLEKILISKRKTNQSDVPKMEKKTLMTKKRSFATIYLAASLLHVKFMSPSIFTFILKDCIKSTVPDDLELASKLLELCRKDILMFPESDKLKFAEIVPRLEKLSDAQLLQYEKLVFK